MSLVPIDDEGVVRITTPLNKGYVLNTTPFVTVYEKLVDGLIFRYADFENKAFVVIKDAATQIKLANPVSSAREFHRSYKTRFPNSFYKFKVMTPGGPQEMLFADLKAINIFCSRSRNVEASTKYINRLTLFQKWFIESKTNLVSLERQLSLNKKFKKDLDFLLSENKSTNDKFSILAHAVKQLQLTEEKELNRCITTVEFYRMKKEGWRLASRFVMLQGRASTTPDEKRELWERMKKDLKVSIFFKLELFSVKLFHKALDWIKKENKKLDYFGVIK